MGASLDGLVVWCCGRGVLEVKCPFSCVDKTFLEATSESKFFLENVDGKFSLKKITHTITKSRHKWNFVWCSMVILLFGVKKNCRYLLMNSFLQMSLKRQQIFFCTTFFQNCLQNGTRVCLSILVRLTLFSRQLLQTVYLLGVSANQRNLERW